MSIFEEEKTDGNHFIVMKTHFEQLPQWLKYIYINADNKTEIDD